jgi:O-acetyl-ADP-ribose deacetylase (regulator of RNase III)
MIKYTAGNILDADADALVNTVNCVGIMGRGIALQFKKAFPDNFKAYERACKQGDVQPGHMFVFDTGALTKPRYIVNFPTKRHWKGKSRIEDIQAGLVDLARWISSSGVRSIAIPALGSGLGGLDWNDVKPLITNAFSTMDGIETIVFEPSDAPLDARRNHSTAVPTMTSGRAALVSLMSRYLGGLMDPSISLLEVHKLMYFLQTAGEPLRLRYVKAPYGPYAENLRHVLREIEGHLIAGYADGGDAPDKQISLVPGAIDEAEHFLAEHSDTQQRFERVGRLVEGFETAFGLELLATVHWVMAETGATIAEIIQRETYAWNVRKRQFTPLQIELAADRLRTHGWMVPTSQPA